MFGSLYDKRKAIKKRKARIPRLLNYNKQLTVNLNPMKISFSSM